MHATRDVKPRPHTEPYISSAGPEDVFCHALSTHSGTDQTDSLGLVFTLFFSLIVLLSSG